MRVPAEKRVERARVESRVIEQVCGLLEELGRPRALAAVGPEASFESELGLGSLERVELVSRLEADFAIELPDSALAEATTPAHLAAIVERQIAVRPSSLDPAPLPPPVLRPSREVRAPTLVAALRERGQQEPRRPHIYLSEDGGAERVIRYGELYREALAVAGGLAARGIEPGDPVALMLPTQAGFFFAYAGILLAGGIPVPLYPPASRARIQEYARRQSAILRNAEAKILIAGGGAESLAAALSARAPRLERVATVEELAAAGQPAPEEHPDPGAPALIQYTSGSTGEPKGVLLTHHNLLANIRAIEKGLALQPTDVAVSWLPLYHDMGLIGCWLAPLYLGIPVAILSPLAFLARPERWLWAIHAKRGTVSAAPNFAYELAARKVRDEALEGLDLSSWRAALNGAEPVSPQTLQRFGDRFARYGFRADSFLPVYGLAECSLALTIPPPGRRPRRERIDRRPFETEGRALPAEPNDRTALCFVSTGTPVVGHEIRVVDAEGRELPERVEGRLEFRGPSAMQGYYRNPEATMHVTRSDGWIDSGDRAFLAEGEVFVTGRAKDVVIRAGRNLHPQEIEEIVAEVGGVRRGGVAAFGAPDPRQGTEKLVVLAETRLASRREREDLWRSIQQQVAEVLSGPADDVVLLPPRSLPKTSSGKIRRSECRERYLRGELGRKPRNVLLLAEIAGRQLAGRARRLAAGLGRRVYGIYSVAVAFGFLVPVWLAVRATPSRERGAALVRRASRACLRLLFCRLEVRGEENLAAAAERAAVLVANHASYLDPIPLLAALPFDPAFVVKKEAASWPIVGTFIRRLEHIPVERDDPRASAAGAATLAGALRAHRSLFFFPEGTFTAAVGLRPFKLGAFKLAVEEGCPVVPIALVGTRKWLRDGRWLPARSDLRIVVEKPIRPAAGTALLSEVVRLRDEAAEAIARHVGEPKLDLVAAGPPPVSSARAE